MIYTLRCNNDKTSYWGVIAENINVVILQVTIALCPLTSQSMSKKLLYCFQKLSIKKSRRQMKTREILFLNL